MKDRLEFQELLTKTLETAINQNHSIHADKIKQIFASMELNETQINQICSYLIENKIKIQGITYSAKETEETKAPIHKPKEINAKESVYLTQYYEELKLIKAGTVEEEKQLLQYIKNSDKQAKQRFIELNLHSVAQIASEYKNQGMTMEDLIQEANIALLQSLEELTEYDDMAKVKEFIASNVRKSICEALLEQQDSDDFENRIVEKGNRIFESLKELEELLGEQATVEELANYMNIPAEDIMDTLELLGDTLELEPNEDAKHHNHEHHDH